jgi:hypothetical protein
MRFRFAVALGIAALLSVSCGGVVSPSNNVSETFSGTLEPPPSTNNIVVKTFSTTKSGEYNVTITALAPTTNLFLGIIYGQAQSNGQCGIIQQNNFATLNTTALAGAITPGTWCVAIYDPGTLTAAATFTVTIKHP